MLARMLAHTLRTCLVQCVSASGRGRRSPGSGCGQRCSGSSSGGTTRGAGGLAREVLAYPRQKITLERALAAAQAATAAAAAANQVQWAGFHSAVLF